MSKNKTAGFSLFELLVVVSIVSIMSIIAMPRISAFLNQRAVANVKAQTKLLMLRAKAAAV